MHSPLESLADDVTTITVNQRLARGLRSAFDARQQSLGSTVWECPDVLPLRAWLERCWLSYADTHSDPLPLLLNGHQERCLWEKVIRDDRVSSEPDELLQISAAARMAQDGLALLRAYRCERDPRREFLDADSRAFLRWSESFSVRCRDAEWLDAGSAWNRLIEPLRGRVLRLPPRIVLAGFDELTPQQSAIFDAVREAGVAVDSWLPPTSPGDAARVVLPTPAKELETVAGWARSLLQRGEGGPIGVVLPRLDRDRAKVERVFSAMLCPAPLPSGAGNDVRPFNISLGVPLARIPVARDALLALALVRRRIALTDVGQLLRSAFLAGSELERSARARFDSYLREVGEPELTTSSLAHHLRASPPGGRHPKPVPPILAECFERIRAQRRAAPARQGVGAWSEFFSGWLRTLGWPGERTLDSAEYQAVQAFQECLEIFSGLDRVLGPQSCEAALSQLKRVVAETVFQPKSEPAPIQISGVLEATGLTFSHLWVAGLDDSAWPRAPGPNPFLPIALQRRLHMPHASPERELEFTRVVTRRLLAVAPKVVVSSAAREDDNALRPSPLIASLPLIASDALSLECPPSPVQHVQAAGAGLETLLDMRAPVLLQAEEASGGTSVFADQSACPFRAFAIHRLSAKGLDEPVPGLDSRERGTLVHRVFEYIWAELKDQQRLIGLDSSALAGVVRDQVAAAIARCARERPAILRGRFVAMEQARLERLVHEWLAIEKGRAPFEVIAPERSQRVELGGVSVTIRLDRVDRLDDGTHLLIDYKTGQCTIGGWFGERPDEPQLPLYCVAYEAPVAGVTFAQLRPGELGFKGLAEREGVASGIAELASAGSRMAEDVGDWSQLTGKWRRILERLGRDFVDGDARVDPKQPPKTCRYCELTPLCRIHERAADASRGAEADPR